MKLFKGWNWLFGNERKEKINNKLISELDSMIKNQGENHIKNTIYMNGVCTIIYGDFSVDTQEMSLSGYEYFKSLTSKRNQEEYLLSLKGKTPVEEENQQIERKDLFIFNNNEDFDVQGDDVFLVPCKLKIPDLLVASFIEILEKKTICKDDEEFHKLNENYQALKMFFFKLALNPIESSRTDLMEFVKENDVQITLNGNLVLYRNIVSIEGKDKKYTEFVSNNYFRIKGNKKSPKNYFVLNNNGVYELSKEEENTIGSLFGCYQSLPEEDSNSFTSSHNSGKYTIKIGSIYKIDDNDIDLNNNVCHSGGLHAANVNYNYSGYGDVKVVVLVSPSKAITVPIYDRGKLRTVEMFICCINDKNYGEHYDEELSTFDEEYHNISIGELQESIKDKSFEILTIEGNITPLSKENIEEVVNILDVLKSKVVENK